MGEEALILLVDDRQDDVLLALHSFEKAGIKNPTRVVTDGDQAIAYLSGTGTYADRKEYPLPMLILLDLKMPRVDGFEVLKWIRSHPGLAAIPVVVLTSSEDIRDVNLAYRLGANSFLVKPMDFTHFAELTDYISEWNRAVQIERHREELAPSNKKVFLRERGSGRFYAGRTQWVSGREAAVDFERIELAEAVASAERLKEIEIILAYQQPACDLTLPPSFAQVRRA